MRPQKGSPCSGLGHVPAPAPMAAATWMGTCDWSLPGHMLTYAGREVVDWQPNQNNVEYEGANRKAMKSSLQNGERRECYWALGRHANAFVIWPQATYPAPSSHTPTALNLTHLNICRVLSAVHSFHRRSGPGAPSALGDFYHLHSKVITVLGVTSSDKPSILPTGILCLVALDSQPPTQLPPLPALENRDLILFSSVSLASCTFPGTLSAQ